MGEAETVNIVLYLGFPPSTDFTLIHSVKHTTSIQAPKKLWKQNSVRFWLLSILISKDCFTLARRVYKILCIPEFLSYLASIDDFRCFFEILGGHHESLLFSSIMRKDVCLFEIQDEVPLSNNGFCLFRKRG